MIEDLNEDLRDIDIIDEEVIAGGGDMPMQKEDAEVDYPNMDSGCDRPPM